MDYEIKNFETKDTDKFVGFKITDEKGAVLFIDKYVPLQQSKTNEQYISEALALCQSEIEQWQSSSSFVGRKWNPESGSLE
jgi:hypothetical protein